MTAPETADHINVTAADWVARSDRGLSDAEKTELAAWLAGDRRRAGAHMRMTAVLAGLEAEAGLTTQPCRARPARKQGRPTRRQWLIGGGALAASLAGVGLYSTLDHPKRYETRKGEKRVVALDDGSVLTLNTATRLELIYSNNERLVRLEEGEALFDVASDPARPFIVRAGETSVRAIGTSFTVANVAGEPLRVLVREGVVEVQRAGSARHPPMRVRANTRATVANAANAVVLEKVEPSVVGEELAWQQGRLVFTGESLSTAVARFARYSDTRIVVLDPALASAGVAGVFDANDPVGFAQAAALSLNARTEVREGQVLIRP